MGTNLPAKPTKPLERDLISDIAMDIGKEVVHHIEGMYPLAIKAAASTFRQSVRNCIYNEIMATIEINDHGEFVERLERRKKIRRHMNKHRKLARQAKDMKPDDVMKQLEKLRKESPI